MPLTTEARTSYHEAGHAVVAHHLHSRIKSVTIKVAADYPNLIKGQIGDGEMTPRVERQIEQHILILLAGGISECRASGQTNGIDDHRAAMALASRRFGDKKLSRRYLAYLRELSTAIVDSKWTAIEHVAKLLLEQEKMRSADIHAAITRCLHRRV
jgi:hypothetical protein